MAALVSLLLLAGFTVIVLQYWERLMGDDDSARGKRWFWRWYIKGVAVPMAIWVLIGTGAVPGVPSLLGRLGPNPAASIANASAIGLVAISSYWSAMTLAWLVVSVAVAIPEANRRQWRVLLLTWSMLLLPAAWALVHFAGWMCAGIAAMLWLLPIAHGALPLRTVLRKAPIYGSAIAKMKFGKYDEAEWEVIRALEDCDDDFQGWMMLAELYACHFNDLASAERTMRELCTQPNVTPSDVGVAMHRLADWHLQFGDDPGAARRALEEICTMFPGTHLDRMARLRINRLPASTEELRQRREPRRIAMPKRTTLLDVAAAADETRQTKADALAEANKAVAALEADPNDVPSRERFAGLLAERLDRAGLAVDQLELLIAMPGQPPAMQAKWLARIARWQLSHLRDEEAGRKTLRRLVEDFPRTREAFEAQCRLHLIDVETRLRHGRSVSAMASASGPAPVRG
jgi:hypothetical protein